MQLTHFDRWLREKFVYVTYIHTLSPPASIPAGIESVVLPDKPGLRYKFRFITHSSKAADALIRQLKESGQMYTIDIQDRNAWFVPFIAPKDTSVTWWLFSLVCICTAVVFVLLFLKGLMDDPVFRKDFLEAIEIMKG